MFKRWKTRQPVGTPNADITAQFGELAGGILHQRGIVSDGGFVCAELPDPMLIKDMDKASEIVLNALEEGKKITVYGDYDCDGVCSTAILYNYLEAQGAEVDYYIPNRLTEGYGMNLEAVKKLAERGTELVITVDNGISAHTEARYLKENGVQLVITDHHQPSETLPECDACIDPHRGDDNSPFENLCGAGVALMLLAAMEGDSDFVLDRYSDLAACATVADVVPLKGVNRFIVSRGLESIRNEQNAGLTKLIKAVRSNNTNITASELGFYVAPKINAAGRIATADKAVELLLCEDDIDRAGTLTEELLELNAERQRICDDITSDARRMMAAYPLIAKQRVIVLAKEGWHHGVIGIVCSRILEEYGKPVVMMSIEGENAVGSMRSIEGYSAFKLLDECADILTRYGGHTGAGGFSLPADKIPEFTRRIHEYSRKAYPKMPEYSIYADMEVTADMLTAENVAKLKLLEPFGEGNEAPVFRLSDCVVSGKTPRGEGKFTAFKVTNNGVTIPVISFNVRFDDFYPNDGDHIDIIASAELNEFNGNTSVQLRLEDFRYSDFQEDRYFAAMRVYEEISRGEGCDARLLPRVLPQDRTELMPVFDMLRRSGGKTAEQLFALFSMNGTINYCKLRVTLDVFADAGMISVSENGAIGLVPNPQKRDLFAGGGYLDRLKNSIVQAAGGVQPV